LNLVLALRVAVLGLRRSPGPTLLAIGILALGLAAPATFFSLLVGAIRPLPVPDGERVVRVDVLQATGGGRSVSVPGMALPSLRGGSTLEALGAFQVFEATLGDADRGAARVSAAALTPEVLPILRIEPVLGRIPGPAEGGGLLFLGAELWEDVYGRDPAAIGRSVSLDGQPHTLVGVMPEGFGFPYRQNVWVFLDAGAPVEGAVELVGRLAPGGTVEAASQELGARWVGLGAQHDPSLRGTRVEVRPFTGGRGEGGEAVAFTGLVLVALCLLVIACANVANLLLVRATERIQALGIQAALGAGRSQIAAQLLFESLLVSCAGGLAGLGLAVWAVSAVENNLAAEHFGYFWMRMAVDARVMWFVGLLVLGAALAAGLLPVLRVLRADIRGVLNDQGNGAFMSGGGGWGRWFVSAQLALSCGALVAAGLTGKALAGSRDFGRALPGDEVLVASLRVPGGPESDIGLLENVESAVAAIPGARSAALALGAPGYLEPSTRLEVEGTAYERPEDRDVTLWNAVTPGFFSVLDLPSRLGRTLTPADVESPTPVAVVNESFVRRFAPGRDVLGLRVRLIGADSTRWISVVGVVADAELGGGERQRLDRVYVPLGQAPSEDLLLLARGSGDGGALNSVVREAVAGVDPDIAMWRTRTLAGTYAYMTRVPRVMSSTALAGGSAGLLVAAVGLYGLLAFRVRQRKQELGVRLALGADGMRLAQEVLGAALRQLLPAVAVGLALAWLAAPALSVLLLGLDPRSPTVYTAVAVGFLATGLCAAALPALRAARVDPARALRRE
jgi:predicted permease